VVSNPVLFPEPVVTDAPASLCDLLPTFAALAGVDASGDGITGRDLTPVLAEAAAPDPGRVAAAPVVLDPVAAHPEPAASVQDEVLFTFDDHQAGSAFADVAPQPNRIRAVRNRDAMYAVYFDPSGAEDPQYELYDMTRDPDQVRNLVYRDTGRPRLPGDRALLERMRGALESAAARAGAYLPG